MTAQRPTLPLLAALRELRKPTPDLCAVWRSEAAKIHRSPAQLAEALRKEYGERAPELPAALAPARKPRTRITNPERWWTPEQDAVVLQITGGGSEVRAAAEEVGRTPTAVRNRRLLLARKVAAVVRRAAWTPEEDSAIREVWAEGAPGVVRTAAAKVGRSVSAVKTRALRLGLIRGRE